MELLERLFLRWRAAPSRTVLVDHRDGRREVTAVAFKRLIEAQAGRIHELKARGGRALGLASSNGVELAAALLAALEQGVAVAPLPLDLPSPEVAARARAFGLDAVWSGPETSEEQRFEPSHVAIPEDTALLLTTSGTTGEPRAVVVGRDGLSRHTLGLVDEVLGLVDADTVLAALPLAHSFGCRMALLAPLAAGAIVHLVPRFSARQTAALLESERLTWAPVVPTMLSAWCATAGPTSLRWVLSAGAPLTEGLRARAQARLGCEVREGYGLTEASFCTLDRPSDPCAPGTVGRPTPGVEVRLSAAGEVEVKGPNLMLGYLGADAHVLPDGWLQTGDIGAWRDGRLVIVDRIKDIVLAGGFTVHPAEVERALSHVDGVSACAVFGVPDAHLGERVAAAVVGTVDLQHLQAEAARHLPRHAIPSRWFFVSDLPLGPSGKVQKRSLREQFRDWSGPDQDEPR